jgi:hypothetical protein
LTLPKRSHKTALPKENQKANNNKKKSPSIKLKSRATPDENIPLLERKRTPWAAMLLQLAK